MKRLLLLLLLLATPLSAQTVSGDRFTLNTGPCVIRSGSSAPEGVVVGNVCDQYIRTETGTWWRKNTGNGTNTGWYVVVSVASGTTNRIPYASGPNTWTDSANLTFDGARLAIDTTVFDGKLNIAGGTNNWTTSSWRKGIRLEDIHALELGGGSADKWGLGASSGYFYLFETDAEDASAAPDYHISIAAGGLTNFWNTIQHPSYASQTSNWRIAEGGQADFRYIFADELRIKLFSAEEEAVYRASLMVTPSHSEVSQTFTCPAAEQPTTLWVRDAATLANARVFAASHWVVIRNYTRADSDADGNQELTVGDCVGQVSGYTDGSGANEGQQSWTFTRGAVPYTGTMPDSTQVAVGNAVLDFATSGTGVIELNAYDGAEGVNAPWIQTKRWSNAPIAANWTVTSRLGKLTGITGVADDYGLYAGTGYTASNGRFLRFSSQAVEIHGVDLSMWEGSTRTVYLSYAGPSFAMGNPLPSGYGVGDGIWMGLDNGLYKFRVGSGSQYITWSGTGLTVNGTITANSSSTINGVPATTISGWRSGSTTYIDGGQIYTGSITASKLLVTSGGKALNQDPDLTDQSAWSGGATIQVVTDGQIGNRVLRSGATEQWGQEATPTIPIDRNKTYRVSMWVRGVGSPNGTVFGVIDLRDSSGNVITGDGSYWLYWPSNATPTTWTYYEKLFGVGTTKTFPDNGRTIYIGYGANYGCAVGHACQGYYEYQDIRVEEVLPSTLIQDGAITTDKVAANAITAGKIAANTITASQIAANTITGAQIAANAIDTDELTAGAVTAEKIDVTNLEAISAYIGNLQGGSITGTTITPYSLQAGVFGYIPVDDNIRFNGTYAHFYGYINLDGNLNFNPPDTDGDYNPLVNNGNTIYEKTDGVSAQCDVLNYYITVEGGIVTDCTPVTGESVNPITVLRQEIALLQRRIAELEASVMQYRSSR